MDKMKRKVLVIIIIAIVIFFANFIPYLFTREYTVDFNEYVKLTESEKNEIKDIIKTENEIEITRISYDKPYRHETTYYICYKDKTKNENHMFFKVVMNTHEDEDFIMIKKICNKYYRWWRKKNNTQIDKIKSQRVTNEDVIISN